MSKYITPQMRAAFLEGPKQEQKQGPQRLKGSGLEYHEMLVTPWGLQLMIDAITLHDAIMKQVEDSLCYGIWRSIQLYGDPTRFSEPEFTLVRGGPGWEPLTVIKP